MTEREGDIPVSLFPKRSSGVPIPAQRAVALKGSSVETPCVHGQVQRPTGPTRGNRDSARENAGSHVAAPGRQDAVCGPSPMQRAPQPSKEQPWQRRPGRTHARRPGHTGAQSGTGADAGDRRGRRPLPEDTAPSRRPETTLSPARGRVSGFQGHGLTAPRQVDRGAREKPV